MDQCCDRQKHLFYVFDWDTNTWEDEYITPVSTNELPGASVEISTYYLNEKKQCTNIKWPKCIQQNVDYVASNFIVHYKLLQHAVSELFRNHKKFTSAMLFNVTKGAFTLKTLAFCPLLSRHSAWHTALAITSTKIQIQLLNFVLMAIFYA